MLPRLRPRCRRSRRGAECGNRIEQATPVADQGNAEILQVIGRQTRQLVLVDLVIAESLLVSLQPEPPQPAPNVHRVVPALVSDAMVRAKGNACEPVMRTKQASNECRKGAS
jgi:hypothetical protein